MDCDNHTPPFVGEIAEQLKHHELVADVEVRGGLVEDGDIGILRSILARRTRWRSPADTAAIGWSARWSEAVRRMARSRASSRTSRGARRLHRAEPLVTTSRQVSSHQAWL